MSGMIVFEYQGQLFEVGLEAYSENLPICLPTGEFLKASGWAKTSPPQPTGLRNIGRMSTDRMKHVKAERVDTSTRMMDIEIMGQTMQIPMRQYHAGLLIQLPNGSVCRVKKWYDGCPQKPFEVEMVQPYEFVRATEGG
jgi:hypothetical protein